MADAKTTGQADIVVVGSGVAGAIVAHQMALAGKSVILLEAGPRMPRWEIVERFRNQFDKSDNSAPYPSTRVGAASGIRSAEQLSDPEGRAQIQLAVHPRGGRHDVALGGVRVALHAERLQDEDRLRRGPRLADGSTKNWRRTISAPKKNWAYGARRTNELGSPRSAAVSDGAAAALV